MINDIEPLLKRLIQEEIYISHEIYEKAVNIQQTF
jgi:predicted nucleic acid-binding protein